MKRRSHSSVEQLSSIVHAFRKTKKQLGTIALHSVVVFLSAAIAVSGFSSQAVGEEFTSAERDFTLKVLPLLKDKCLGCHGGDSDDIKGDFSVLSRESLLRGGESEEASVVPGKPEEGTLLAAVRWDGLEMPPKENDRLTETQIKILEEWVKSGAPWPTESTQEKIRQEEASREVTADGRLMRTSGGTSSEWTNRRYADDDLWGFKPVKRLTNEEIGNQSPSMVIDAMIHCKLDSHELAPAPPADARTLIRRAYFDLLGLPPSPEEVDAFLTEYQKDAATAWESLVDRLLASPHFGEHWAGHWFDVVRYADTGGMANDYERSNMWRYRDYVIRAFNNDKPYDEFVMEQIAGDEIADQMALKRLGGDEKLLSELQSSGQYSPEEAEKIIATGFLRLGPWDNAMVTDEEARQIYLDDAVNAVGQTFLSTTMRCFKCHDHKFDPLPTRDYYRMYAALSGTWMAERPLRFVDVENRKGFEEGKAFVEQMLSFATKEKDKILDKQEKAAKAWYEEHNLPYKTVDARKNDPDDQKPPRHVGLDHVEEGQLKVREQDEWIWQRNLERYQPMVQSVYNASSTKLAWNGARKLRVPAKRETETKLVNFILAGGSLEAKGDKVGPGVLSALGLPAASEQARSSSDPTDPYLLTENIDGRRTELARWIAHPQNALTTRSIVNRVWQYHFGKPLAGNPNNFGVQGAKPTHPELLDFLAADFVEHGWKLKRLHKAILMSQTYQRSSQHPELAKVNKADPNNDWLAAFPVRRLTAEQMRDAMLTASGELNDELGGLPVMPEINMEVALQPRMIQFSLAPSYQPSPTPVLRNRRSVYAYRVRGQADPFMEVFNKPNPNDSCDLRDSAAVSPQAFTLLNSDSITDRSIAIALSIRKEGVTPVDQIQQAFELILNRPAGNAEVERLKGYLSDMQEYHEQTPAKPVVYPTEVTRLLVEEFSGQTFEYQEILPVFHNYTPDKKASDVDAETRALADVCLLLLNSHEFVYLN
jgi:Protein of unknown function (DUF1553)/Protein of unknown function (DUF1549)/Planctomycete cytochrome C